METWYGAAGICINENSELLMVQQGKPEEEKTWSVPSGELEDRETFQICCSRELAEETRYIVEIGKKISVKRKCYEAIQVRAEVHYYLVKIIGGKRNIQDPDGLIYDIAWINLERLKALKLSYPEDRPFLLRMLRSAL
ncbi:NUDIX hydrolase [Virgibacillus halodenitrificans]|uniref:NUDIX hydrolase n=1 Tax=Virgibacillus halodenitrificans TaxID=1482 RepID=UPI001F3B9196|nr:NUDIX hydrolase [Virgibacillus halodenitrificans]